MKTFVADLWADLREKRLWPVAVLLLVALVAVPVVLKKSSEEPPPAKPVAAQPRSAPEPKELKGLASVKLEEADIGDGSSLDTFDPANPFRPPESVIKQSEEQSGEVVTQADEVTLSDETVQSGSGGAGTTSGEGATGGGTRGDTGGEGTGPGDGSGNGDRTTTETTQYTYVLDVTFVNNGRTRKLKGMERLDMLPSAASPLLLFLGASTDGGNAVFLVDSTLQTAGEGKCKPSPSECAFLHLGAGSEHMFTNEDGDSYTLRVDQIRTVKVDDGASASASRARGRPRAALASPPRRRRFAAPLISDLVSVSSRIIGSSNGRQGRR
jgi:hypothetical protein